MADKLLLSLVPAGATILAAMISVLPLLANSTRGRDLHVDHPCVGPVVMLEAPAVWQQGVEQTFFTDAETGSAARHKAMRWCRAASVLAIVLTVAYVAVAAQALAPARMDVRAGPGPRCVGDVDGRTRPARPRHHGSSGDRLVARPRRDPRRGRPGRGDAALPAHVATDRVTGGVGEPRVDRRRLRRLPRWVLARQPDRGLGRPAKELRRHRDHEHEAGLRDPGPHQARRPAVPRCLGLPTPLPVSPVPPTPRRPSPSPVARVDRSALRLSTTSIRACMTHTTATPKNEASGASHRGRRAS